MFKFLLTVAIIYLLYKYYRKSLPQPDNGQQGNVRDILVKDPNCGKYIPKERAVRVEFDGKIYYFCSLKCATEYEEKLKHESES